MASVGTTSHCSIVQQASSSNVLPAEEPPLDDLVYSKKVLNAVAVPYRHVMELSRSLNGKDIECLVGCLTVCKTIGNCFVVIVDQIERVSRDAIAFKHTPKLLHPITHLCGTNITDQIFRDWIDQLVARNEPLPLFVPLRDRKMNLMNRRLVLSAPERMAARKRKKKEKLARNKAKRCAFRQTFGKEIDKVLLPPWKLLQLLQLGPAEFEKVVAGAYVCCANPWSVQRIERVSWDAVPPYELLGQQSLTVLLHFKDFARPLLDVEFSRPKVDLEIVENWQMVTKFIPPTDEHIAQKSQQLEEALANTPKFKGGPSKKKWKKMEMQKEKVLV